MFLSLPGGQQRAPGARAQGCYPGSERLCTSPLSLPVQVLGFLALPFGGLATSSRDLTRLRCWLVGCFTDTSYTSMANLVLLEEEQCKSFVF